MNSNYHQQQLQPQSGKYSTQLDLSQIQLLGQSDLNSQRLLFSEYQFGAAEMGSRHGYQDIMEGVSSSRISSQMKITLNTALRQPRSLVGSRRNSRSRDLRGGQASGKNNGDESSDHQPSVVLSQVSTSEQTASQASNRAKIASQQSKPSSRRSSNAYLNEQINGGAASVPISQVSLNNQVKGSMLLGLQSQLPSITPLDSSRKSAGGGVQSQRTALGGHLQGGMMTAPLLSANLASKKMPQDFFRDYHQQTRVNAVKLENVRMKRQALLEQSQIIATQQDQSMMMMVDHQPSENVSFNESLNLSYLQDQPKSFVRRKMAIPLLTNVLPLQIPYQDPPFTPLSGKRPPNSSELNSARPSYSNGVSISQSQVENVDDSMMIYRTIDEKPQPHVLGSSYKVGQHHIVGQFASGNVLRSSSIDRKAGAAQSQNTSLGDFSSLSLSKVPDFNRSIAPGGNLGLSKQLFSPERENSKYVMKPISIKTKSQPYPSESSGMMMQTANFPNGPVQEPVMILSPGFSKKHFSQSGQVDLSMMKESNENQKENTPKNMNVSEQVQRLISHRRSNSQGSEAAAFIRRKGSKNKQTRGLAQKIVLPKNSSFLHISGIGSQTGAQIVMDGYKAAALQSSEELNGGGRDYLPKCIINFNISFGNFPKLENYQHFKSSTQVMNSPIQEDLDALKDLNSTLKKPQVPTQPHVSHNLSPKNLALPFGSLAQNPLSPESPLIIESAFKNILSTEKKLGTSQEVIEPPHFLKQEFHLHPAHLQHQSTSDQLSREQREHLQKLNDKDLEEIRRTIKTPCFNSTLNAAGSAHKVPLADSLAGDRRMLRPKVAFPKMII